MSVYREIVTKAVVGKGKKKIIKISLSKLIKI